MPVNLPPPPKKGSPLEEQQWREALWRYVRELFAELTAQVAALSGQVDVGVLLSTIATSNGLVLIRGSVASDGSLLIGEGFTPSKGSTGVYSLTWTTAFVAAPVVVASVVDNTANRLAHYRLIAAANSGSPTTVATVRTYDSGTTATDVAFSFVAVGERVAA